MEFFFLFFKGYYDEGEGCKRTMCELVSHANSVELLLIILSARESLNYHA